jgi:hypothetical protein
LLDEDIISDSFKSINVWAYKNTIDLVSRYTSDTKNYVFLQTNFMYLCAFFVQIVMSVKVLKAIQAEYGIEKVAFFKKERSLLAAMFQSAELKPHLQWEIEAYEPLDSKKTPLPLRARVRNGLAALAYRFALGAAKVRRSEQTRATLVSGSLNHLSGLADRVKAGSGHPVIYVENEFNWEKYDHCKKSGIGFLLLDRSREHFVPAKKMNRYFAAGSVLFEGADYTDLYEAVFDRLFRQGSLCFPYDYDKTNALLDEFKWEAVVLDEDWAMRRQLSVMADLKGIRAYVVSHGVPGILFDEEAKRYAGSYHSAKTFVSSEFEKEQYEDLCFKPERVLNTGVPRYDEIASIHASRRDSSKGALKNVLYCGAGMQGFDFEFVKPSLGLKIGLAESTRTYTEDILDICAAQSDRLKLSIKPHYSQERQWKAHIDSYLGDRVLDHTLHSHRDNTFRLEADADVVVTVESSVICEAIMFEKPVIVLNYSTQDLTTPYDKLGMVELVRNKEELKQALDKCLFDEHYLSDLAQRRKTHYRYYAGLMDGKNTDRVCREIVGSAA